MKAADKKTSEIRNAILEVIQDARSWMDIKQIALLSDVSLGKCRILLPQLVAQECIGVKHQSSLRSPDGVTMYAKISIAKREDAQRSDQGEFKCAKSRFTCWPQLLEGKGGRPYIATQNQAKSLAMLARKP